MKAVVGDRGQVTISKALREQLGIAPRTVLDFYEENGKLVAEKDAITQVRGCIKHAKATDEILAEMRDNV